MARQLDVTHETKRLQKKLTNYYRSAMHQSRKLELDTAQQGNWHQLGDVVCDETKALVGKFKRNCDEELTDVRSKRDRKNARKRPKVEMARLWRNVNAQQYYTCFDPPETPWKTLLGIIAVFDYYVFAQVIGVVLDTTPDSLLWYLGGLLGLLVFVLAYATAVVTKESLVARKQWNMLRSNPSIEQAFDSDGKPVELAPMARRGMVAVLVTGLFVMAWLGGLVIRVQGADGDIGLGTILMQALIPLVPFVLEFLKHDPLDIEYRARSKREREKETYQAELNSGLEDIESKRTRHHGQIDALQVS